MPSKYPYFRQPPEGKRYRVIEIDPRKQTTTCGCIEPDEKIYTTVIGDFNDWDDAVAALRRLTHRACRRMMWSARMCVGENNHGAVRTFDAFK